MLKLNFSGQKEVAPSLPRSSFGLTKKDMEEADKRAKEIIVPVGDSFRPGPIFSRLSKLNSHEWKEVRLSSTIEVTAFNNNNGNNDNKKNKMKMIIIMIVIITIL